jgi:hypothetical protein
LVEGQPPSAVQPGEDVRLSISGRLLRLAHRPKETKEVIHPRDLESLVDSLIDAHQPQAASIFLPTDIGSNQRPNPGRIRQRDIREVQNEPARAVGSHFGLKAEYIGKSQWSRKAQNADPLPRAGKFFDVQWLVRHARNVNGE